MSFDSSDCKIINEKTQRIVATTKMNENQVFILQMKPSKQNAFMCSKTANQTSAELWHHILGHINYDSMNLLQSLVEGMPSELLKSQNCDARKITQVTFSKVFMHYACLFNYCNFLARELSLSLL